MALTKRCFMRVESLRRLTPQVLRDLLGLFPDYVARRGLVLPAVATEDNLDYDAIRDALAGDAIPPELDDILYMATGLGNAAGWEMIRRQASEDGRPLRFSALHLGYVDLAILAAVEEWPRHRLFLEKTYARARVHACSAYKYYAPMGDPRRMYRPPTEAGLAEAREALARHFLNQGMVGDLRHGLGTEIVHYDHAHEIWFLIRYPEKQCRQSGCTPSGDWRSFVFNPEHYHAVAYSKVFADIRMNAKRERDRRQYRMVFGRLLFGGASNVFQPNASVVTLAPLLEGRTADLFGCDDIPGLAMIAPTAIDYEVWGLPPRMQRETAQEGETLLSGNPHGERIVPAGTLNVRRIVMTYRLRDCVRTGRLTLQSGNQVKFERDGDSVVIEAWLRRRGFVQSFVNVEGLQHGTDDLDADCLCAAGS